MREYEIAMFHALTQVRAWAEFLDFPIHFLQTQTIRPARQRCENRKLLCPIENHPLVHFPLPTIVAKGHKGTLATTMCVLRGVLVNQAWMHCNRNLWMWAQTLVCGWWGNSVWRRVNQSIIMPPPPNWSSCCNTHQMASLPPPLHYGHL